ncbi:MAG: asparagine synthase C-terminal domain-containing protein [Candidatus Hodarchaeales archaeon]
MKIVETRIKQIIEKHQNKKCVGLLFSGGLDSSIIAKCLVSSFPPSSISAVCIGLPNSYDLNNAISGAAELGLKLHTRFLTTEKLIMAIQCLKRIDFSLNVTDLTIAIPLFLGLQTLANEFHVNSVFLGQGADELFGGYKKYIELINKEELKATKESMKSDFRRLMNHQILMEKKIAQLFHLNLVYPFLDPLIIDFAQSQPVTAHFFRTSEGDIVRKALLRGLAMKLGLSKASQPKKAMQYGSGTVKLLRKFVRSRGYQNIPEWFHIRFLIEQERTLKK